MSIKTIETDIMDKLSTVITDLKIEGFPDNPNEYRLIHPKGAILVAYNSSEFDTEHHNGIICQLENLEYGLTLIVRNLRDTDGAYDYIDLIKSTLTGYAPTGCKKMYLRNISFLTERDKLWQYGLTFVVPSENYAQ